MIDWESWVVMEGEIIDESGVGWRYVRSKNREIWRKSERGGSGKMIERDEGSWNMKRYKYVEGWWFLINCWVCALDP